MKQESNRINSGGRRLLRVAAFLFFTLVLGVAKINGASAASLNFSPASGTHAVGQDFQVTVFVSSPDTSVNAIAGKVHYPADQLTVENVSTGGSIISFWVSGPTTDASNGLVNFEGVALNPAYQGSFGEVVVITFRGHTPGPGSITFNSGSVLANDGKGTNVLSGLGSASYTITGAPEVTPPSGTPPEVPVEVSVFGPAVISSPTHPDPTQWYSNPNPTITWVMDPTAVGANVEIDQLPDTKLIPLSLGRISSKTFYDLKDGVWYAHVRLLGPDGWVPSSHFKLQIDTTPPDSFIIIPVREDPTSPVVHLIFQSSDALSGIDHYEVSIDGTTPITWHDDNGAPFATPPLDAGVHVIHAYAVDMAGNRRLASVTFTVTPKPETALVAFLNAFCDRYCPSNQTQFLILGGILLILIIIFVYLRRRQLKKKLRVLERDLARLERVLAGDIRQEVRHLEAGMVREAVALEAGAVTAVKQPGRWISFLSADRKLHHRFTELAEKVEREVLALEEKKAARGLTPHEAHRLKDLLEVLSDTNRLKHHVK